MARLNIFITGASGFIGKVFVSQLLALKDSNFRLYILTRGVKDFNDARIEYLCGDLSQIESFSRELQDADYIFHLAANATFGDKANYNEANFEPTKKIVDLVNDSNRLRNLIFVSSIGAVDRGANDRCEVPLTATSAPSPTSSYGQSKLKAENYLRQSGVKFTIVRPSWVYGPGMRAGSHISVFVNMVLANSPFFRFNFPGKVSLVHVNDLAFSLIALIDNESVIGKTIMAATESLTIGKIFSVIYEKIYKTNLRQVWVPSLSFLFGSSHHFFSVTVSNLFINYLWTEDTDFLPLLKGKQPISFIEGVQDVIDSRSQTIGYWVITGANSGIGLALAKKAKELKKKLILIDRDLSNLGEFKDSVLKQADLTDRRVLECLGEDLQMYSVYCLVNNAGVGFRQDFSNITHEQIVKTTRLNIETPIFLTRVLLSSLIKMQGTVINIASSAAYNPLPGMSIYAASKSFVLNWSQSLWYELKGKCRVITVSPSGTNTNFQAHGGVAGNPKNLLTPEYVAMRIMKAMENSGEDFVFIGRKNQIFNIACRILPTKLNIRLWGILFSKLR